MDEKELFDNGEYFDEYNFELSERFSFIMYVSGV